MRTRLAPLMLLVVMAGCAPVPAPLGPEATIAFHATRVVQVLDVVRDAAIASNEVVPPLLTTDSTRKVVLYHRSAVQTIRVSPSGWRPTVKAGLFELTCHPMAAPMQPPPPCTPQLAPAEVTRLYPFVALALIVIEEVK